MKCRSLKGYLDHPTRYVCSSRRKVSESSRPPATQDLVTVYKACIMKSAQDRPRLSEAGGLAIGLGLVA